MQNSDNSETIGLRARRPFRLSRLALAASLSFLATWLNLRGNHETL